jgi:phosphoglycolate phosphatase-like HAD superfamily hydrolase
VVVFDIDGVLADVRHRLHHVATRPKDWDAFFAAAHRDPPLPEGRSAADSAAAAGCTIVYLTGRPEHCRAATIAWLDNHGLPPGELIMRGAGDRRPARVTKVGALRALSRRCRIAALVDDDRAVVDAAREAGFRAVHAQWMGTEEGTGGASCDPAGTGGWAAGVLSEIQQREGRT